LLFPPFVFSQNISPVDNVSFIVWTPDRRIVKIGVTCRRFHVKNGAGFFGISAAIRGIEKNSGMW